MLNSTGILLILVNQNFSVLSTNPPHLRVLSQINPLHSLWTYVRKIHSNVFLSPAHLTPRLLTLSS